MIWAMGSHDVERIRLIQQKLNEFGFGPLPVDGDFGTDTQNAVVEFQTFHHDSNPAIDVDGVVGGQTFGLLFPDDVERESKTSNINNQSDIMDVDFDGSLDFTDKGVQLILEFEVGGGQNYYNKFLKRPTWPEYASGVTIGVGYDLGYNTKATFDADFEELDPAIRERLYPSLGIKGRPAKALIADIKDINIPWELAYKVFIKKTLPKWYGLTKNAYKTIEDFHPNVKSALTSLVFNRGALIDGTNRRLEMKRIRDIHVPNSDYASIAQEIRNMKRIWAGSSIEGGMNRRREAEARLVESAIS